MPLVPLAALFVPSGTGEPPQGERFLGVGTNLKMYLETGGQYYDITPIRVTTSGAATFAADGAGLSGITVTEASHGAETNDFVTFSGAVSLGGNITADVLNQEYMIASVVDSNTYMVVAKDTSGNEVFASASDTGNGGGSIGAEYQVNTGLNAYLPSTGWSVNGWGESGWGSTSGLTAVNQLRVVSQDAFGDNLIFNNRAGGVYIWQLSSGLGSRGVKLNSLGDGSAPENALSVMVSDVDRHVVCFGATPIGASGPEFAVDPLLIRWSDQENATGGSRLQSTRLGSGALCWHRDCRCGQNPTRNTGQYRWRAGVNAIRWVAIRILIYTHCRKRIIHWA